MSTLGAMAAGLGMLGVVLAAAAVFLSGPVPLVRGSRISALGSLALSAIAAGQGLWERGGAMDPRQRGGTGSLFAAAGMLLLTFGALRVAERRRLEKQRAALKAATEAKKAA